MTDQITIVCGTNRKDAVSLGLCELYASILKEMGVESQIINLEQLPHDFAFSALYKNAGKNAAFNSFREQMETTQKFVFVVPEYNGSFPGVLKTFIDGLKFPTTFTGKKAGIIGVSSGTQGSALAMSHLTDILNYCGTNVLAYKPRLSSIESHYQAGALSDEYLRRLHKQAQSLVEF